MGDPCDTSCGTRQDGQGQKDPCDTSCGTRQDGQGQTDPCDTSCGTRQDGKGQKDPCDTSCGTRQDGQGQKDPSDTSCGTKQDKADKSDKRINFAAFQKTRLYYEGLSSQEKEEFWGRVRRGNKADETKDSGTSHLHREFGNLLQWMQVEDTVKN